MNVVSIAEDVASSVAKRVSDRVLRKGAHEPASAGSKRPLRLSRELPVVGHMVEFVQNPFALLERAQEEARSKGADIIAFRLLTQDVVLVTGTKANEAYFRAPDDVLDRREAYKLMTPIFGEGVVFDAPGKRLDEQIKMVMQALRDQRMRGYPPIIEAETRAQLTQWADEGDVDLLDFMKMTTLYTSNRSLVGEQYRRQMTPRFHEIYKDLENGVNPIAYLYPHAPLPSFKRRDAARAELVQMVDKIIDDRKAMSEPPDDGLQTLLSARYKNGEGLTAHEITGILIALMLAGHHTSAGTATWVIIELLRNPQYLEKTLAEIDRVWDTEGELTYHGLRQMRYLGNVIDEVLRVHPPLIFLFRKVMKPWTFEDTEVPVGTLLCASPAVSNIRADIFPQPQRFDPDRYERGEADNPFAHISFGGGKHKCPGNAFGILQIKAIMAVLLREYSFTLGDAPGEYVDDYTRATVLPKSPAKVRYHKRTVEKRSYDEAPKPSARKSLLDTGKPVQIHIDTQLCVGHQVCVSEAPEVFRINEAGESELIMETFSPDLYPKIERAYRHCPNRSIALTQDVEGANA